MRIGKVDVIQTGKQVVTETLADDVPGLAAELAYRFFLALFPFFIFLAALGGVVAGLLGIRNPTDRVMQTMEAHLPTDAAGVIRTQLEGVVHSQNPGLLSFGLIGALWAASSAFKAVMKAMNRAYDVEETRAFWTKYLVGLGLTLLAGTFVIGAFLLLVAGQFLIGRGAEAVGLAGVWGTVLSIIRWPVAIVLIMVAMAFLYWAAPNIGLPFKWITPGAVVFTLVWVVATLLFGFYVANFGSYNATYGALGGVVVLLLWFYITGFIMLVGAELNAIIDEQVDPEKLQAQRRQKQAEGGKGREQALPGQPGAHRPWRHRQAAR